MFLDTGNTYVEYVILSTVTEKMQKCDSFKASQLISSIKIRVQINHFLWKTEILKFYYVPSSMLGPLQMLSHLILTIFLQHRCFYYLSFTVEGFEA